MSKEPMFTPEEFRKILSSDELKEEINFAIKKQQDVAVVKAPCCGKTIFHRFTLFGIQSAIGKDNMDYNSTVCARPLTCYAKPVEEAEMYVCTNCDCVYETPIKTCGECGENKFESCSELGTPVEAPASVLTIKDAIRYCVYADNNLRRTLFMGKDTKGESCTLLYAPGTYNPNAFEKFEVFENNEANVFNLIEGENLSLKEIEINR